MDLLKNWLITFERSDDIYGKNKTTGTATVTASTRGEAIKDFKEIYRHCIYKILSCEEVK